MRALLVGIALAVATLGAAPARAEAPPVQSCSAASTLRAGGEEFRAPATRGEVWALPLNHVPPIVGQSVKIVWRVTGSGPLRVVFRDPTGARHPLEFGPQRHGASTFRRPGQEWGTGFAFDAPGCWTIQVRRTGTSARVGVLVA